MSELKHTHEQGGECLACDIVSLRSMRQACEAYRAAAFGAYTERALLINEAELAALDRVEAALAEREHLEESARLLRLKLEHRAKEDELSVWLMRDNAERVRKAKENPR